MSTSPFFFTWTAQDSAFKLPLDSVDDFSLCSEGRSLIDMSSLSYQASFGLKNKAIIKAMSKQMMAFSLASPKNIFKLKEKVAHDLAMLASAKESKREYRVFFTQSGSESIENALKMARQISAKRYVLCQQNSYHGSSLGALSVTGDWRNKNHLSLSHYSIRIPGPTEDPEAKELEAIIVKNQKKGIAAICLETITGGNGVIIPSAKWYVRIKKLCKQYDILLILDEVVCGAHRTGPFFGFQNYKNLKPDFICLAKALTGGYFPLGATLVSEEIAGYYDKNTLSCGLTNYAHPIGLAALAAVLKISEQTSFQKKLERNIHTMELFAKKMQEHKSVEQIRRIGMLMAIVPKRSFKLVDFLEKDLFVAVQNGSAIVAPSLVIQSALLKKGLKKVTQILEERE